MKIALSDRAFSWRNFTKINDERFDWSLNSRESARPELTGSRRASGACRRSHFGSEEAVRLTVRFTAASAPAVAPSDLCSEQKTLSTLSPPLLPLSEVPRTMIRNWNITKKRENCETLWRQTHCYRSATPRPDFYFLTLIFEKLMSPNHSNCPK